MQEKPASGQRLETITWRLSAEEHEIMTFLMRRTGLTLGTQVMRMCLRQTAVQLGWVPPEERRQEEPAHPSGLFAPRPTGTEGR